LLERNQGGCSGLSGEERPMIENQMKAEPFFEGASGSMTWKLSNDQHEDKRFGYEELAKEGLIEFANGITPGK
jgi:hypothetical protein